VAEQNQDFSLRKLAEVIADADKSGVEFAEYLKTLRRTAKDAQDTLEEAERAHLDNLRLIRDDAQARLTAAEAVANVCSATKSRKTRKDKGTQKGPKNQTAVQQMLIPDETATVVQDEPKAEQDDQPF